MHRSIVRTATQRIFAGVLAAAFALEATPARAMNFGLEGSSVPRRTTGLLIPCIRIGTNASPRVAGIEQRFGVDEAGHPTFTVIQREGGRFSLLVSAHDDETGETLRILPPGPCRTAECADRIQLVGLTRDGTAVVLRFTVSSPDGRLDPGSIRGFNPQPEPPGDFDAGVLQIDFTVTSDAPASTAVLTLTAYSGDREVTFD